MRTPFAPVAVLVALALGTISFPARAADPDALRDTRRGDACVQSLENGTSLREQRRLLVASALYRECAAATACSAETRAACASKEAELGRTIPTITIAADGEASKGTLMLDGSVVASNVAIAVDPGAHAVVLAFPDGQKREERVIVTENERARVVLLAPPARAESSGTTSSTTTGPYLVGGAGVLLLLGAATLQTFARVEDAHAQSLVRDAVQETNANARAEYFESASSHYDAAQVDQAFAITLAALGAVTVAIGVTWWVTSRTQSKERVPTSAASRTRPASPFALTF